jgi:hypothetical protein
MMDRALVDAMEASGERWNGPWPHVAQKHAGVSLTFSCEDREVRKMIEKYLISTSVASLLHNETATPVVSSHSSLTR